MTQKLLKDVLKNSKKYWRRFEEGRKKAQKLLEVKTWKYVKDILLCDINDIDKGIP